MQFRYVPLSTPRHSGLECTTGKVTNMGSGHDTHYMSTEFILEMRPANNFMH